MYPVLTDSPGPASIDLDPAVWLENRTYSVFCNSSDGNPQNEYAWALNADHAILKSTYSITAHKEHDQAVLTCIVSNKFTEDRNASVYDTKQLAVHCKFIINTNQIFYCFTAGCKFQINYFIFNVFVTCIIIQ